MNHTETLDPRLEQFERRALLIGIAGLVLCAAGYLFDSTQFFRSYLLGFLFWIGIALGSLSLIMLHHLAGGGWGFVIQRFLESSARTIPLLAVLTIPLLLGMPELYVWARPEAVAQDELLQHKSAYLNVSFFIARTAAYFLIWAGLARFLTKWSVEQDRSADPKLQRRLEILSGPGLVLMGLTMTFASVDWAMSLDPHWFSTIYGVLFIVGSVLATLAFAICTVALLGLKKPLSDIASPERFQDLGNLLLAFVMLWAYISFSQYLIIWSGNLPEEIPWYVHRAGEGWVAVALVLIVFHFAVPFVLLLSRRTKRQTSALVSVAGFMLVMRFVDLYWIVVPSFHEHGFHLHWMDLAAPIGIGGVWLAVFAGHLKKVPSLPLHDPRLAEVLRQTGGHQ